MFYLDTVKKVAGFGEKAMNLGDSLISLPKTRSYDSKDLVSLKKKTFKRTA